MPASPPRLTLEEVATYPLPGTVIPTSIGFTPDDARVTYLFSGEGDLTQQLYAFDPADGSARRLVDPPQLLDHDQLPLEEQLRRERLRERGLGITRYAWSKSGGRLLVPLAGDLYVQDGVSGPLRLLLEAGEHPAIDPTFSPDGTQVAFVRDAELAVVAVATGEVRELTRGARGTGRTHGLAEYIAQEEMKRFVGFWWSPDGRRIAFTEVDETHIPVYRIPHPGKDRPVFEDHRYPFAGEENARVRLAVVPSGGGEPVWMDLGAGGQVDPHYLARVLWLADGTLLAAVQPRSQQRLDLVHLDPATGRGSVVFTETSDLWVNLHLVFHALKKDPGAFVWADETTGFCHLLVIGADGRQRRLTSGPWMVHALAGVDEERGQVYFVGSREDPRDRQLYAVPLAGGEVRRITRADGVHEVSLDKGFNRFVDRFSTLTDPPRVTLRALADDAELAVIHGGGDARVDALALPAPELFTLESRDGVRLYGALYRPEGEGPWPVLVNVYGGPHAQRVTRSWGVTVDLRAQYYRERGWAVLRLDNRGSWGRGLAFEGALHRDMGTVEIDDQVDGVRRLVELGLGDPDRVGIYGWSYGGYAAAMALAKAPEVFHAAVAGAPVTHWDGYDTHYTERYMGTPQDNPEGYARSAVMAHVGEIEGDLLLVHGMIDENVHFRHTARLVNALVAARKPYEILLFPDERHMPRRLGDRVYLEQRIEDFLARRLWARVPTR